MKGLNLLFTPVFYAREENLGKHFISLDLEKVENKWTAACAATIANVFQYTFDESRDSGRLDNEFAEREGVIHIPRLMRNTAESSAMSDSDARTIPQLGSFYEPNRRFQMSIGIAGQLDSIVFKDESPAAVELSDGFVEIEPHVFGLNFRDIMVAMGQLDSPVMGFECSGVIRPVGAGTSLKVGDRVCAITVQGHWANFVCVRETSVVRIPDKMPFEMAASIPLVFVTA